MRRISTAQRAERLRLLTAAFDDTAERCEQLRKAYSQLCFITPEKAKETARRIAAMTPESLDRFFEGYPMRVSGETAWRHIFVMARQPVYDPEELDITRAVEGLNKKIYEYDRLVLDLRTAELIGGLLPDWKSTPEVDQWIMALELFSIFVVMDKIEQHCRSSTDPGVPQVPNYVCETLSDSFNSLLGSFIEEDARDSRRTEEELIDGNR